MSRQYDSYLKQHRDNVKKGYDWLATNLPECIDDIAAFNIDLHDASKDKIAEYDAYDNYFYGNQKTPDVIEDFNYAWLHHIHCNPHHWQYWVLINDEPNEGETVLEMPYHYILEMICDWWAFSWSKGDLTEIFSWYDSHKKYIKLHNNTRSIVEEILGLIKDKLEENNYAKNQYGGGIMDELMHYGVKGMKWGIRRYQNKDGTLTNMGKARRNMDAVNDIVSTMSKRDKELLNLTGDVYQRNVEEGANVVKRIVKRVGGTPVSFLDITGDSSGVAISIGTRSGDKYRNKGYASAVAKQGKKWLHEHADEFDQVVWWARKDNPGSIKTAQKIGLELDESSVLPDDPWVKYERKKK